eukprot:scaffold16566_cov94-Skeletonema_dohrnii-CCMP3373.AAC.1
MYVVSGYFDVHCKETSVVVVGVVVGVMSPTNPTNAAFAAGNKERRGFSLYRSRFWGNISE